MGKKRLKEWTGKYGKWLGLASRDTDRALGWFDRHGPKAVFFCRMVPGVRSFISIPAGIVRMNLIKFLLYTAVGTGLWSALLAYSGRLLGENYEQVARYLGPAAFVVLGSLGVAWLIWLWKRQQHPTEVEKE